jgi:hypothetical protein
MRRYDEIARAVVATDPELAIDLIAMLHNMAALDSRLAPSVDRARELQAALRYALGESQPAQETADTLP